MPKVNHDIIRWARETAGLAVEDAAHRLGINDARGVLARDRLLALERGDSEPSRPMLLRMSKLYRRSLLVFYLSTPPRKGDRGDDYRTLPENYSAEENALLDVLIRDVRARQSMVRAALEGEDEADRLEFVGSKSINDGVNAVLASIQEATGISVDEFRRQPSTDAAFSWLRERIEAVGVFVLLISNLGSYHSTIHPEIFRGIALSDEIAPFVIVNDQDAKSAWSFTLLHELTHLWLGQTGVSAGYGEIGVEQFCNEVASRFLLPVAELRGLRIDGDTDIQRAVVAISEFAEQRHLSSSMVAYGLFKINRINFNFWQAIRAEFKEQWQRWRHENKERLRAQGGGPDYYVVRRHHLGAGLIKVVQRMVAGGALTTTKAALVLGVRPKSVREMIDLHGRSQGRRMA